MFYTYFITFPNVLLCYNFDYYYTSFSNVTKNTEAILTFSY